MTRDGRLLPTVSTTPDSCFNRIVQHDVNWVSETVQYRAEAGGWGGRLKISSHLSSHFLLGNTLKLIFILITISPECISNICMHVYQLNQVPNDLQWEIATFWVVIRINMHYLLVTHNYYPDLIYSTGSFCPHSYSYGLIRLDCNYSITRSLKVHSQSNSPLQCLLSCMLRQIYSRNLWGITYLLVLLICN